MRNRLLFALAAWAVAAAWTAGNLLADDTSNKLTTNEMIFRSTHLEGLNVFNRDKTDNKLGHLSDLLIDAHSGQALFGILDTGIGGKYIPVPWTALQLQKNTDSGKFWLTLSKTADDLKNAPTFDKNNQPDFASSQWRGTINRFFGVQTVARPEGSGELSANELVFRSSQLEKLKVFNEASQDNKLGSLDDLIIDAHTGQVMYGVLDTGIGGKHIPVPWAALKLHEDKSNNKNWLTLNKTSDDLKNAPTIDTKNLPDFTGDQWKKSVDTFFGVRTVARPNQ